MSDAPQNTAKPLSAPQKALHKLGLYRDIDLALHLPLRYEDETRIVKLRDAREGEVVQIEARVVDCEINYRPRKQLIVRVDDGSETCTLRFFNFYPAQQKALAVFVRAAATCPPRSRRFTRPWRVCRKAICARRCSAAWRALTCLTLLPRET